MSADPLRFRDNKAYADRLKDGKAKTGVFDALGSAVGMLDGRRTIVAAMEYGFIDHVFSQAAQIPSAEAPNQ